MNYNWNWHIFWEPVAAGEGVYWEWLVSGLAWTVATSLLAWVMALALGAVVGVVRTAPVKWAARLGNAYVELFRNIPLLVQMFLWFFVLPEFLPQSVDRWLKQDLPNPEFVTAVVALGFFTSARVAEQVRAGINSLPRGQKMAAQALGLTLPQAYRHVLLPMALRIIIPPLTSEFMNIFKNSSVALTIGLLELTAQARAMNEYTFQGFETFTAATVLYVIVAFTVNRLMAWIENHSRVPGYITGGGH
jgi:glutamate/aspartate transport system permease protein